MKCRLKRAPKMIPKWLPKSIGKSMIFSLQKVTNFQEKWTPNGAQNGSKFEQNRQYFGVTSASGVTWRPKGLNGAKMVPTCLPKGCQMELKSSKMDPEWAPEGFKMDPNWMSNHAGTKVFGSKLKSKKNPPSSSIMQRFGKDGGFSPHRNVQYIYIYFVKIKSSIPFCCADGPCPAT